MGSSQSQNILKNLRDNWFLVVFIGSIIIGWSTLNSRVEYLEQRITKVEDLAEQQQKQNNDITGAIIEIKANYLFIKEKLEKLDK